MITLMFLMIWAGCSVGACGSLRSHAIKNGGWENTFERILIVMMGIALGPFFATLILFDHCDQT